MLASTVQFSRYGRDYRQKPPAVRMSVRVGGSDGPGHVFTWPVEESLPQDPTACLGTTLTTVPAFPPENRLYLLA